MKIDSITFSPNCQKITIVVSDVTANSVIIKYENLISTTEYTTANLAPVDNIVTWEAYYDTLEEESSINGVVNIQVTPSVGSTQSASAVASCELYCCVAKLVEEGINCSCKCSKCDEDIRTAEKVHLLIKSAEASANQGNDSDAVDKYNKAKTYCTSTCGCGC